MPQDSSAPSFFMKDPFTEEVQGPLTVEQLRRWYAQGGFEDWLISKSSDGPWKQASKIKGLNFELSKPTDINHIHNKRGSKPVSGKSPSPPTVNSEPSSQSKTHKKISLGAVGIGLLMLVVGVSLDNQVLGGLGFWTMVLGAVFWQYGDKILQKFGASEKFSTGLNQLSPATGQFSKLMSGGAAVGLIIAVAVVLILWKTFSGPAVPSVAQKKSGEDINVYTNRMAKEVFAGTWEASWDNSDIVARDGSRGGTEKARITLIFNPTSSHYGTVKLEESHGEQPFTEAARNAEPVWTLNCSIWPKVGCTGSIRLYSTSSDENTYGLFGKPEIEFVLKSATEMLQTNGSSYGDFLQSNGPPNPLMMTEVLWKKVN